MKHVVIYAHYFYPDVASTGQICFDLCKGLKEEFKITVVCTVPSYSGVVSPEYKTKRIYFENIDGIDVVRVKVPEFSKQNKKSRIKHILAYFFRSIKATFRIEKADIIFSISQPPILGGLLGRIAKGINRLRGKKSKFIYNIQDYNPEQIKAINYGANALVIKILSALDKKTCKKADEVIVVASDMVDTMKNRFTKRSGVISKKMPKTVCINNWIDDKEVYPLKKDNEQVQAFKNQYGLTGKRVIMYSGNIGLYYDLENIIKVIGEFKDNSKLIFPFVGDGARKKDIEQYVEENGLKNVIFIPYQDKKDLIYSLNSADILWVVNAKGIKGVSCPSKIYGALATAKSVLGVLEENTEARNIIEKTDCGYVCSPQDYEGIKANIEKFSKLTDEELDAVGQKGYKYLEANLTKDKSIQKYKEEFLSL